MFFIRTSEYDLVNGRRIGFRESNIKDVTNIRDVKITDLSANPAPLGLRNFRITTILLNIHSAGFYPMNATILSMGLFYCGLAQVIAG